MIALVPPSVVQGVFSFLALEVCSWDFAADYSCSLAFFVWRLFYLCYWYFADHACSFPADSLSELGHWLRFLFPFAGP